MPDALQLLEDLDPADCNWLLEHGTERQVISGSEIAREGVAPPSVWIVLEGLMAVTVAALPGQTVARIGPGELFGEIAFLEGGPASASVTALENSLLLEVASADLRRKAADDHAFAGRLHRALARMLARRLRATTHGELLRARPDALAEGETWAALAAPIEQFKALCVEADKQAQRSGGEVPDPLVQQMTVGFTAFARELNHRIGDHSELPPSERDLLGHRVQREVLPLILMSDVAERMYSKPRGYAGDYFTIELMYRDRPSGSGRLGPAIDRACRSQPANRAVMNRRALLADEIAGVLAERGERVHVTSLASGPAAELFDVFATLDDPGRLRATCLDIDFQALGFVGDKATGLGLNRHFDLHNANLVYLATGRKKLDLVPQDLMYSIGLIDYFADKFVVALLDWIFERLRPGGRVILGNFHVDNPNKAMMDHLFEWKLTHRSEDDMNRLLASSRFGRGCTRIRYEDERVNMFAMCEKPE